METLKHQQEQFIENILHPDKDRELSRFSIYYNNWRWGLIKALKHTYPVCEKLTGSEFFLSMANYYVKSHFSSFYTLNDYGSEFPEFIAQFEPASSLPYLSDVAKLEWMIHCILIGNDNSLIRNSHLLESDYPIYKIWETNQEDYVGDTRVVLSTGPERLFIWRQGYNLKIDLLDRDEWKILSEIKIRTAAQGPRRVPPSPQ